MRHRVCCGYEHRATSSGRCDARLPALPQARPEVRVRQADPAADSVNDSAATVPAKRKKGAPSKRERDLVTAIRDAADDLVKANDYAEGYMTRSALVRAMRALNEWAMKGRPHV